MVTGSDGDTVGKVGEVYFDNETGEPNWVTVKTGWFGTSESFVPLAQATIDGNDVRVPLDKETIKGAPNKEAGEPLSEQDEDDLYSYYGLSADSAPVIGNRGTFEHSADPAYSNAARAGSYSDARTANSDEYLTRSEEQLHVGTEQVQTGRARLRKYVVTEQQTVTVPVAREEVRLEREPIAPDEAVGDIEIADGQQDVVLTEERVVVNKETVPVERVRLGTETVTENQAVTEEVRKEEVEFDTDLDGRDVRGGTDTGTGYEGR